uniref:Uncharacterized protein n=2 Tax=Oryza sativa subsp. japonica TaxID=39947 RepID=Q6AU05_ORYSJ|nr:hypothetical protein [Oryza sativa Japonica Group]ABF98637.1 hypothetical protein LOC_Os03g51562 [Oryza sativa Japonica Group]
MGALSTTATTTHRVIVTGRVSSSHTATCNARAEIHGKI